MTKMLDESAKIRPPSNPTSPGGERPRRKPWRFTLSVKSLALFAAALIIAYLALVPVGTMVYAALRNDFLAPTAGQWTLENLRSTVTDPGFYDLFKTSVLYATGAAALATGLGFVLAFLVSRTDVRCKVLIWAGALFPLVIPGVPHAMAWVFLLSPTAGVLNQAISAIGLPPFNLYSMRGLVLVEAVRLTPIAFLMGYATFSGLDGSLEEAAKTAGANAKRILRTITLPLVLPSLVSVAFLMFVLALSTFEVPQLIGVPGQKYVFVTRIYDATKVFPPDYGVIGAIGLYVLVIATVGLIVSQRIVRGSRAQTITGKGYRPSVISLGRAGRFITAGAVLFFVVNAMFPIMMLVWASLMDGYRSPSLDALGHMTLANYGYVFSDPHLIKAAKNTVLASFAAAIIVTVLATLTSFLVLKTKIRGRGVLSFLAMVPIAVPSIIIGIGILFWYLAAPLPVDLYGTLWILIVAYATTALPYAMQYLNAGMNQVHQDLEDASSISGGGWARTMWTIYLPLLRPALLASMIWTVMLSFREITSVILLYTGDTEVLSVLVYNLWGKGDQYPLVAALGVVITITLLVLMLLLSRLVGGDRLAVSGRNK